MSTRSVVARPLDGGFEGRYIHSDGYPSGVGRDLHTLVLRDGVEKVREVMIEQHYGWSYTAPGAATEPSSLGERGKVVPGYGLAYTDTVIDMNGAPYQQATEDKWIRNDTDDGMCEYAYVLNDKSIAVLINEDTWKHVTDIDYTADLSTWDEVKA